MALPLPGEGTLAPRPYEPLENNSVMTHPPGGSVPGGARGLNLREDYYFHKGEGWGESDDYRNKNGTVAFLIPCRVIML